MKTLNELLIQRLGFTDTSLQDKYCNRNTISVNEFKELATEYAKQVAQQALNDAAENCIVYIESRFPSVEFCECVPKFDKESITKTKIQTL